MTDLLFMPRRLKPKRKTRSAVIWENDGSAVLTGLVDAGLNYYTRDGNLTNVGASAPWFGPFDIRGAKHVWLSGNFNTVDAGGLATFNASTTNIRPTVFGTPYLEPDGDLQPRFLDGTVVAAATDAIRHRNSMNLRPMDRRVGRRVMLNNAESIDNISMWYEGETIAAGLKTHWNWEILSRDSDIAVPDPDTNNSTPTVGDMRPQMEGWSHIWIALCQVTTFSGGTFATTRIKGKVRLTMSP